MKTVSSMIRRRSRDGGAASRCFASLVLFGLALGFGSSPLRADTVTTTDGEVRYPLGLHLEILEDAKRQWDIDDVSSPDFEDRFVESDDEVPNLSYTESAVWVRLRLENTSSQGQWWLELARPNTSYLDFHAPRAGGDGFRTIRTGNFRRFDSRDLDQLNFVFKLNLLPGEEQTVYLRLESESPLSIPLTLWSPEAFATNTRRAGVLSGGFYGLVLIMVGYSLFLSAFLRDRSHFFFALFLIALLVFRFWSDGVGKQIFWPNSVGWSRHTSWLTNVVLIGTTLLFTRSFLDTARRSPKLDAWIRILLLGTGLSVLPVIWGAGTLTNRLNMVATFLLMVTLVTAGYSAWWNGHRAARYFSLAVLPFFLGVIGHILYLSNISTIPILQQGTWLGTMAMVLLFSVALADRINITRQEKDRAQAEAIREHEDALARERQLGAVARSTSSALDLDELVPEVVRLASELIGAESGAFAMIESHGDNIRLSYPFNAAPGIDGTTLPRGKGISWEIVETERPLLLDDYSKHPRALPLDVQTNSKGFVGAPVMAARECLGVLGFLGSRFSERDLVLVESVGRQAGVAIRNARLFKETRRQLLELRTLHAIATAAVEAADEDALIEQTTEALGRSLGCDRLGVFLDEDQNGYLRAHQSFHGLDEGEAVESRRIRLDEHGTVGSVARGGIARRVSDAGSTENASQLDGGLRSQLCVPIKVDERVIGVLDAESQEPDAFDEEDERLLITVAGQLATGIARFRSNMALKQLNDELEARVAERTAQLQMTLHELESFSYSVSHDLRAPLRSLDGFSRMLLTDLKDQLPDSGVRYLNKIRSGAQRMAQLIDDLLRLSRVSRQEIRRVRVDLSELADSVIRDLQHQEPQRKVEAVLAPALFADGDARLLQLAVRNLLENAWKYTSKNSSARIEFGVLESQESANTYFVRDDGVGFDSDYAHKLFSPFRRLHSEAEFEGTGIGLATVQRVVQRHGGRVWAEGTPGEGAAFFFTLSQKPHFEGAQYDSSTVAQDPSR